MTLKYEALPCQTAGCSDPASQLVRYREPEPKGTGSIRDREVCEGHARSALEHDPPPFQVKPLASWSRHLRLVARQQEEEERKRTMAAQVQWDMP